MDGFHKDLNLVLLFHTDYQVYLSSMDFRSMSVRQEDKFFLCYFGLSSLLFWMEKCNDINTQEVQSSLSLLLLKRQKERINGKLS